MAKRLYVAYGSNLNLQQMGWRCPTAKVVGTGKIENYQLLFNGVATIVPKELTEFCKGCNDSNDPMYGSYCSCCGKKNRLTRPPKSWCYVEAEE